MIIRFGLPQRFIVKAHHHSDPIRACFQGDSCLNNRKGNSMTFLLVNQHYWKHSGPNTLQKPQQQRKYTLYHRFISSIYLVQSSNILIFTLYTYKYTHPNTSIYYLYYIHVHTRYIYIYIYTLHNHLRLVYKCQCNPIH